MSMTKTFVLGLCAVAAIAVASCGGEAASDSSPQVSAAARKEARLLYDQLCWTCHGKSGRGDGPGSSIEPKPRDYTDKTWQASVTDEEIKRTITLGGAAVGKSPAMPAQPQLKSKPEVLQALVDIVRSFGK